MHYIIKPKVHSHECNEYEYKGNDHDFYMSILSTLNTSDKFNNPNIIIGKLIDNPERIWGDIRCIANNIKYVTALTLDYDKKVSIQEFHDKFKAYRYYLYTTWSHFEQKKSGGTDRFRVIVPLDKPLDMRFIGLPWLKKPLIDLFMVDDTSCFDRGHWQILPCAPSIDQYTSHYNAGMDFSLSVIKDVCMPLKKAYDEEQARPKIRESKEPDYDRNAHIERFLNKSILPKLDELRINDRGFGNNVNKEIGKLFGFMMGHEKIEFYADEVESILLDHAYDSQTIKDIHGWKKYFESK